MGFLKSLNVEGKSAFLGQKCVCQLWVGDRQTSSGQGLGLVLPSSPSAVVFPFPTPCFLLLVVFSEPSLRGEFKVGEGESLGSLLSPGTTFSFVFIEWLMWFCPGSRSQLLSVHRTHAPPFPFQAFGNRAVQSNGKIQSRWSLRNSTAFWKIITQTLALFGHGLLSYK